jgi:hypothetical protein
MGLELTIPGCLIKAINYLATRLVETVPVVRVAQIDDKCGERCQGMTSLAVLTKIFARVVNLQALFTQDELL